MRLTDLTERAREIAAALSRFSAPVDHYSVLDLLNNNDPSWREDAEAVRLNFRAIDLLSRFNYVTFVNGSAVLELTNSGRKLVVMATESDFQGDWVESWAESEDMRDAFSAQQHIDANTFNFLRVDKWRQFEDVEIQFHPRLTILTGANATGKTTLLNILARHLNWRAQLIADSGKTREVEQPVGRTVGSLSYTNGVSTSLLENPGVGVRDAPLALPFVQAVPGLFISSHRSLSAYQPLAALPPEFSESDVLLAQFASEIQVRYSGGTSQYSPLYRMKEALFAAAMYAYGSEAVEANESARQVWEQFQEVLHRLLPSSLEFTGLIASRADIKIRTRTTQFPLEAVSGGISAMLELAWQIFLRSRKKDSFTVVIDEPENHLHPELQRTVLPNLMRAFPQASFIVATHSPFVVTSDPSAAVYALSRQDATHGVVSHRIETANFAGTADDTLLNILGLDTSLPLWAENRLRELLSQIPPEPTAKQLRHLRDELNSLGLSKQFPAAVQSVTKSEQDDQVK